MAGEIFIYSDDMYSIFGSYLIGPRLYDREKAIKYYKKAADLGSGIACHILGDMLSGWNINAQLALDRYFLLENMSEIRYKGGFTSGGITLGYTDDGRKIRLRLHPYFTKLNDLNAERYAFDVWKLNDRFKVDFDTAKSCYELGTKLGNDICNKRLEKFERKIRSVKRQIKKSMIDPLLDEPTMSTYEIEDLLKWAKEKYHFN